MLEKFSSFVWKINSLLYYNNMSKARKLYTQKLVAEKLEELRKKEDIEDYRFYIEQREEFLAWAKENQEVPSIWDKLFIKFYVWYLKINVVLCKLFYLYWCDEYMKVDCRNAIADMVNEWKTKENADTEMRELNLQYTQLIYKWMCDNQ